MLLLVWAVAALLAAAAAGEQVMVRTLAAGTAGLPTAEVMQMGHVLAIASDAGKHGNVARPTLFFVGAALGRHMNGCTLRCTLLTCCSVSTEGKLVSRYCVDLTCKTTLASTLVTDVAQGEPHVRRDPQDAELPIVAFQYAGGQRVGFGKCKDQMCQSLLWLRDVAVASAHDKFEGGVSIALASRGAVHLMYRRAFVGAGQTQCMLIQCGNIEDQSSCFMQVMAGGADEGGDIGPDSLAMLPDERVAVLWRSGSEMMYGLCPALPEQCVLNSHPVVRIEQTAEAQGKFCNAAAIHKGLPVLLYSLGDDAATAVLRLVRCLDESCSTGLRIAVSLPRSIPAYGAAFAAEGFGGLVLAVASPVSVWRVDCQDDPACPSPSAELMANVSAGAEWVPASLQAASGGSLSWVAVVRDTAGVMQAVTRAAAAASVCDGQGWLLKGCKSQHESCQPSDDVGLEGTCTCLEGSVADAGTGLATPFGCCTACGAAEGRECWQGVCSCAGSRNGTSRDGTQLACRGAATTAAPEGMARGPVAGLVIGMLMLAILLALGAWLLMRYRRRRANASAVLTSTSSFSDVGQQLRPSASDVGSGKRPASVPPRGLSPYDENDEYSAHDFL